jgi:hypothetical protein
MKYFLSLAAVLATVCPAWAQETRPEKSKAGYTLVNPTPRDQMRDMSTDRPDKTESPYTVDAGHFQAEISLLDFTYANPAPGESSNTFKAVPSNLKMGLLNNVDFQFVLEPYVNESSSVPGGPDNQAQGFGDIQFRTKFNLWGNDGGKTAFALMPFIQLPTGTGDLTNNHVEGGLIVPLAIELAEGWGLGLMGQLNAVLDNANDGYGMEFVHTITTGFDLVGDLAMYVEYAGTYSVKTGNNYQGTVGTGFTYALTEDIQFDIGTAIGVTRAADVANVFVGISVRY